MNTFLKVLLYVVLTLIAIKLMPLFALAFMLAGAGLLVLAGLLFSGIAAIAGCGVAGLTVVITALVAVIAVLSPIWIPVLIVVGIIALIRRSSRTTA